MRVTKIEIYPVTIHKNPVATKRLGTALGTWGVCRFVIVKAYTDQGIVGVGEAPPWITVSREGQGSIVATIKDHLGPIVIGNNPFNIEALWKEMDRLVPGNPMAKCALDVALYDIMGKALSVPMYNLIGGLVRDKIPLAGIVGLGPIDDVLKAAERWVSEGYQTLRFKIGMGLKKDEELLRSVRRAFGEDIRIRVDANQAYRPHEAVRVIKALEQYDIEAVEQPVAWHDIRGLSFVNRTVSTPIMPHESLYDINDLIHLINSDAVSLFGLKLDRPGGITNARKACHIGELYDIPCTVISSVELGISTSASMQLAATIKRLDFACEASGPITIADDIVSNPIEIEDGYAKVPNGIGIGAELDEAKLNKYAEACIVCDERSTFKS